MIPNPNLDLKKSCTFYSSSMQKTLQDLLNVEVATGPGAESVKNLEDKEDLYFSILFTGQIYGEFLFGLSKKTALQMLGIDFQPVDEQKIYWQNRQLVLDSFREVINIAAGSSLSQFREMYPDLSITPPKAIEGQITLSAYEIECAKLTHSSGNMSCYIYIDHMRLEIKKTIEKNTEDLNQEKIKQEELKRLNKAKTEFLANMSHELRTPLNGMIGMLDVLKRSTLDRIQREQFDVIYRSGEFLLSLISDILEFSKIESGKLELEKRSFDLKNAIESVIESLAPVVYQKGLDFNVFINPLIYGNFIGDETRFKQVLVNLVGNAVKFTPTGSITISANPTKDSRLIIKVIDTGIGVPAAKISSIFGSFSQVDVSDNRKYGGTGLGLTISKSIVLAMGGDLSVESQEAKGSQFTIDIPIQKTSGGKDPTKLSELDGQSLTLITEDSHLGNSIQTYIKAMSNQCKVSVTGNLQSVNSTSSLIFDTKLWLGMTVNQRQNLKTLLTEKPNSIC
jgi:signal transduction histidine kinase